MQRLIKFSPRMCPAVHHTDVARQLVVSLVPIRMQPAVESLQEGLRVLRFSCWLVLIQDNGLLRTAAGPVQPHPQGPSLAAMRQFPLYRTCWRRNAPVPSAPARSFHRRAAPTPYEAVRAAYRRPAAATSPKCSAASWPWSAGTASGPSAQIPAVTGTAGST